MSKHDLSELHQLQALSLNEKIERTKARIKQWVEHYGLDHVYVSFSGGKDSTVLLDITRKMYPDIKAVFLDTSLEFPELRQFVSTFENVEILKPSMNFRQAIEKYGYPVISKEVSECVSGAKKYLTSLIQEQNLDRQTDRQTDHIITHMKNSMGLVDTLEMAHLSAIRGGYITSTSTNAIESLEHVDWEAIAKIMEQRGLGSGGSVRRLALLMGIITADGKKIKAIIPRGELNPFAQTRYKFLLAAPFDVSNRCCSIFKKNISHAYNKKTQSHPIIASMASESRLRTQKWLENGCNGFDLKEPVSNPMSFWTDSDILLYIKEYDLKLASVYGDIVVDYQAQGQVYGQMSWADLGLFDERPCLTTTGCKRTGCIGCGFGLHLEKRPNRLEMIDAVSNTKLRDFILRGGAFDGNGLWKPDNRGLGFWFVYQWINVHGGFDIYIPEYERYEKEYGNELTKRYLIK